MAYRPRSSRYTRVGSYLGQVYQPKPLNTAGVTFRPCWIGKGDRLAITRNASVPRSWISDYNLVFSTVAPFVATLPYAAKPDQNSPVSLYDQDGNEIPTSRWRFYQPGGPGTDYTQILFNAADFDRTKTYYIDYQSSARTPMDPFPFTDLRRIIRVGKYPNQDYYQESLAPATDGKDYVIPGVLDTFTVGSANVNRVPSVSAITFAGTGTGTVVFGSSNAYALNQTRYYRLTCMGVTVGPPRTATFRLQVWDHSGLNAAAPQVPLSPTMTSTCTFTVSETGTGATAMSRQLIDGIYLDFAFGAGNYIPTDTFSWFGYGPTFVEAHSAYSASNSQFPTISTPSASGNTDWTQNPPATAANTSTVSPTVGTLANFTGTFVRHYKVQVDTVTNVYATGSLTFTLASITDNEHFTLSNGLAAVTFEFHRTGGYVPVAGRVSIDITLAASDNDVAVAARAAINNVANWPSGNNWVVAAVPVLGAVALAQSRYGAAANVAITAFESDNVTPSTGIAHTGMSGGNRSAVLRWAGMDELPYTAGQVTVDDSAAPTTYTNYSLEQGVRLTWTFTAFPDQLTFVAGDSWTFIARPGREYYNGKDDRVYTLTMGTPGSQSQPGTYAASTIEGGFDAFTAVCANSGSGGLVTATDNVRFLVRNIGNAADTPTGINAPNRWTAGDTYTFAATCQDVINWNIDVRTTESIDSTGILYDQVGSATGVAGVYYVILDNTPTAVLSVLDGSGNPLTNWNWVTGTPYVYFNAGVLPASLSLPLAVRYQWIGREPVPGTVYYVTGTRLRNRTTEYNIPVLWRSMDAARNGLSPSGTTNDILIASEIGSDAGGTNLREWYTCQVLDLDDDGVYQDSDYRTAIEGTNATNQITDLCVLNRFSVMANLVAALEDRNDMFNYPSKVAMGWFGMRAYAPIGDEDVEGSIIYTSKRSLLVSGNSPSHGCHVLIANTWATRDIILDDLSTKTVTLDGSFIACASCAKQDSFTDPAGTILFKDLAGVFNTMQKYTDAEELTLGAANTTFLHEEGTALYRFYESITTDTSAIDYSEISAMKQKHFMTRYTTQEMAVKLTGWVPPDSYAAITQIKGFLAEIVEGAISHGWIAPFGSEQVPPTRRQINPSQDIQVYQDEIIKTDWYYVFWYNLRYPIKRTSGLFGVDSDAVLKGNSAV